MQGFAEVGTDSTVFYWSFPAAPKALWLLKLTCHIISNFLYSPTVAFLCFQTPWCCCLLGPWHLSLLHNSSLVLVGMNGHDLFFWLDLMSLRISVVLLFHNFMWLLSLWSWNSQRILLCTTPVARLCWSVLFVFNVTLSYLCTYIVY